MGILFVVGLICSVGIGLSLGLIGGGGSIITVPVLVYAIGVNPHQSIGMSLAVVGATSAVGSWLHHRRGAVAWKTGAIFAGAGSLGALCGSRLTYLLSDAGLMLVFAALMLLVASMMLTRRHGGAGEQAEADLSVVKASGAGLVVGILTGFLGVGGGFLIVPALVLYGGLGMKQAIGTSLFVIAINCGAGLAGHLGRNGFDPRLTLLVTGLAVGGALFGTTLSHSSSPHTLRRWFAVFVVAVALLLVFKNYGALHPR